MKLLHALKIFVEEVIMLMILISAVQKDSIFSIFYLITVFYYAYSRKVSAMVFLSYVVAIVMFLTYFLTLTNLTSVTSPMPFPYPFNPYPPDDLSGNPQFVIPWYLRVNFLAQNREWALWLGIGTTNLKINGVWIDYLTMGVIQIYFFYFNC